MNKMNSATLSKALLLLMTMGWMCAPTSAQLSDYIPSFGAEEAPPQVRMGLHFLPNVAWMLPRDAHSMDGKPVFRFGFGFTTDIHFSETYSFGTGLNVFHNGGRLEYVDRVTGNPELALDDSTRFIAKHDRNYNNQWVELPLTFKLRTKEIGYMTYWGQFGLGLGLNIRSTACESIDYVYKEKIAEDGTAVWELLDEGVYDVVDIDILTDNEMNIMRAAMIVALGFEYNMSGSTSLIVGATFNNGLFNVINNRNHGPDLQQEHLETASGLIDLQNLQGYEVKAVDNAILLTCGFLF